MASSLGSGAISFWIANGSENVILVTPVDALVLKTIEETTEYSVEFRIGVAGLGLQAKAGEQTVKQFETTVAKPSSHTVLSGQSIELKGNFVNIVKADGEEICRDLKVKENCAVIVTSDERVEFSAPNKPKWWGKRDDMKFWFSLDGSCHYPTKHYYGMELEV